MITCPKCKFGNRETDNTCLFCGAVLEKPPADAPPEPKPAPERAARSAPEPAPKPPTRPAPKPRENNAFTGNPAQNRPTEVRRDARPAKLDSKATQRFTRGSTPLSLGGEVADAPPPDVRAPVRGQTGRLSEAPRDTSSVLCWVCCDPLEPIPLSESSEVTIGRHAKNDLVLPHNEVSRFHASFKVHSSRVNLEDLGSSNGIFVNGARRLQHEVQIGDRIDIGPYQIKIRDPNNRHGSADDANSLDQTATAISVDGFEHEKVALSGNLADTPVAELLQGFEFNSKTGTLVVVSRRQASWLAVVDGKPHAATAGETSGRDAAIQLITVSEGRFTFYANKPDGDREIEGTLTGLLLEASRQIDESSSG